MTKETTRQRNARLRQQFTESFGDYYAQSAGQSVLNDFLSGNFITVHAGKRP